MSLALSSDGKGRSGSGETQARPKASGLMINKHALVHYLNEKIVHMEDGRRRFCENAIPKNIKKYYLD